MLRLPFKLSDILTASVLLAIMFTCAFGAGVVRLLHALTPSPPTVDHADLLPEVETITLEPQYVDIEFTSRGVLAPIEEVTVSAEVSGRVIQRHVEIGRRVAAGDVLLEIEAELQKIQLDEAEANEKRFLFTLENARRQVERAQQAGNAQATSDAQQQKEAADAAYELARQQAETAREKYEHRIVTAPIDGVIAEAPLSVGQFVAEGVSAVKIVQTDRLAAELRLTAPELLALHDDVDCRVRAQAETFDAALAHVAPLADPKSRRTTVRLVVDNAGGRLRGGLSVEAVFDCGVERDALVLPRRALFDEGGQIVCYRVVERNGRHFAERILPEFRAIVGRADRVIVTSGLAPGDRIAVGGLLELENGLEVVLQN